MKIVEVSDTGTKREFLDINARCNQFNSCYIRPLDYEVNDVFDAQKNKHHKYGEIIRWILLDKHGKGIGRIAAFTHSKYQNKGTDFPVGGIGFFDCINDKNASKMLFDTAASWLNARGMKAMDGPINFLDRDKWWGLLVDGFDKEPVYGLSFNPHYYQLLFEDYGFENYYNQYFYHLFVADPLPPRFEERHARFKNKKDYSARHMDKQNLEKYAEDFATIYNAAWAQHGEAKELSKEDVLKLFKKVKPILDERIVWFAYYKQEPIAMWVNLPDLNQYFKHFNGKFGWWEKLKFLWLKQTGACRQFAGLAFGVVPKYQALGIDSFMIQESTFVIQRNLIYDSLEMGWAGDWNPKMISIYKSLGAKESRKLTTYRKMLNTDIKFERHPVIEYASGHNENK
jgi:hypothetical protein